MYENSIALNYFEKLILDLDTNTGSLSIKLWEDLSEKEPFFTTECQLRGHNISDVHKLSFSIPNHPETNKKESFTLLLYKDRRYQPWKAAIYPQYGVGTIGQGIYIVNKTGNNEFFR